MDIEMIVAMLGLISIGLLLAVVALALYLSKLEDEIRRQRIIFPCGCVYVSYGSFGHLVRRPGCNIPN